MSKPIKGSWQSVSVVPGKSACEAVEKLRQQRFLGRDAPRLPLPGCANRDDCQCKYQRHADRRADARRAEDRFSGKRSAAAGPERRRPGERRERR